MMRFIWIWLITLALCSCATVSTEQPASSKPIPWKDRQLSLDHVKSWELNGKIAVQSAQDSGSATIDWIQRQKAYTIALYGPLGSNNLKLMGRPGHVAMQTSDGKHYTAASPEELLAKQWGWHVPVSRLTYWIRGLPAPGGAPGTQFDAAGRVRSMSQDGWNIQYLSYTTVSSVDLPQRIAITSPGLKVKIVVYNWKVS